MNNKLLCLVVAGSVTGACSQLIGISDYEIDSGLGQGGDGGSSRGGFSQGGKGGMRPVGGSRSNGGEVGAGGAGGDPMNSGGAPEGGAGGSDSMTGGQGGANMGGGGPLIPGCGDELLLSPDFEPPQGAWTEYSKLDFLPIIAHEDDTAVFAQAGKYVAWMGGAANDLQSVSQPIQIPLGAKSLVFKGYFQLVSVTPSAANVDLGSASLWDASQQKIVGSYPVWDPSQENLDWEAFSYTINVSALAGKLLDFQIVVGMDATDNTNFFFDTLSLIATCQ